MKKLTVVIVLLLLATGASAQRGGRDRRTLGFRLGLNQSNVTGSDVDALMNEFAYMTGLNTSNELLTGLAFGGFLNSRLSPDIAVQCEFLYTRKGFRMSMRGLDGGADVDFANDYLEVPLLFKFMIGRESTKPCLFAGPAMSLLMRSRMKSEGVSVDAKSLWKKADLSLVFGGGVDFPVGSGTMMMVDGRYTMGVSKIPDDGPEDIDIKNTNFSLMLGFGFGL
jgi:hypothetical protein